MAMAGGRDLSLLGGLVREQGPGWSGTGRVESPAAPVRERANARTRGWVGKVIARPHSLVRAMIAGPHRASSRVRPATLAGGPGRAGGSGVTLNQRRGLLETFSENFLPALALGEIFGHNRLSS